MQALPVVARRRILSKARARLSAEADRALPSYGIPVSAAGWDSVLHDLALSGRAASLAQSANVLASARDAGELRESGEEFVDQVVEFAVDLRLALAFAPARHTDVKAVRESLLDLAERVFQAAEDDGPPPTAVAWDGFSARTDHAGDLSDPSAAAADPLTAAFSLAPVDGYDRGRRTAYQLIGVYRERFDELVPELLRVLDALPHPLRALDGAVSCALRLLESPAPLMTLRTALDVFDAIGSGVSDSAGRTIDALVELQRGVPRSATNAQHSVELSERPGGESPRRDALRELELYKSVVEGQVRPWIWTLLRIDKVQASQNAPMLAKLREQALARPGPALNRAARIVETAVRNAQAHEDAVWDADSEALLIDGVPFAKEALALSARRAYAFMLGAETGLACASSRWADVAYAMDTSRLHDRLRPLDEDSALIHFAMNRLVVRRWEDRRRVFTVAVDHIEVAQIGHCCQALIHAAACLPDAERFVLQHGADFATVLDLPRECLEVAGPVWFWARSRFEQMPPSTFLSVLTEARLSVESMTQAVDAAVWMAVNDVQNDAERRLEAAICSPTSRRALIDRARGAGIALDATATRLMSLGLSASDAEPLLKARQVLENTGRSLGRDRTRPLSARELDAVVSKLDRIRTARPAPAAMPTLDPTPIDQMPRPLQQPPISRVGH